MSKKVLQLIERYKVVEETLGQSDVFDDKKRYKELTREHSYLSEVRNKWEELQDLQRQLNDNRELLELEKDSQYSESLQQEIARIEEKIPLVEKELHTLLVPPDPRDHRNTILEIRAGTGGDEAALFVGDCVRMYKMFSDRMGWSYEHLSSAPSELGGFKEYIMVLSGSNVHRFLQYEGGAHRVQRVPETEAQGRVHTSAVTIAILLEPDEETEVSIDEKDLKVDTYRSSGAGGQHVNTTDSAVRLTHNPTGIVVYCQEERSQHKNKEKAMRLLKAKIAEVERQKKQAEISSTRAQQVGSGDRSERIRTYNFSQNRITDHRINYTKYNLDRVLEGELEDLTSSLVSYFYQQDL